MRSSFGHRGEGTSLTWKNVVWLLATVAIVTAGLMLIPDGVVEAVGDVHAVLSPWLGIASVLLIVWAIWGMMRL